MGYRSIAIKLIIRIILIFLMLIMLAWIITIYSDYQLFITTLLVITIIGLQVWELIRWLHKTNKILYRFFETLRQGDFMTSFDSSAKGATQEILLMEMNRFLDTQAKRNSKIGYRIGFLEVLVEHLPNGIICWGKRDQIVFQNPASVRLMGFTSGSTWTDFFKDNPDIHDMIYSSEGPRSTLYTNKSFPKSKSLKIEVWPFTILGEDVRVMTIENITSELEKKEAESWQDLLRLLSHEIRNSITPVSSLTETMSSILKPIQESHNGAELSEQNVQDIVQALNIIHDRTIKLRVFTENVLKVTRIPAPEKERISVKTLFDGIIAHMKGEIEKSNTRVEIKVDPRAEQINVDKIQFDLILTNLITNSLYALKGIEKPEITISAERVGNDIDVIVEDNGLGIAKDKIEKIFMPFFTTRQGGNGLGLSIVRQMVSLHKGSVHCESEPGKWTRFVIRFPDSPGVRPKT